MVGVVAGLAVVAGLVSVVARLRLVRVVAGLVRAVARLVSVVAGLVRVVARLVSVVARLGLASVVARLGLAIAVARWGLIRVVALIGLCSVSLVRPVVISDININFSCRAGAASAHAVGIFRLHPLAFRLTSTTYRKRILITKIPVCDSNYVQL